MAVQKRKACVVITARPSYSRIRTALQAIQKHVDLELQIVAAASLLLDRYGNAINHIIQDGFKVDAKVYMVLEGENLITSAKTTGLGMVELATVFDNLKPDMVITIADRYETIATAISAAYMNIPLVHVQGGEVTGSIDEKVRHAITKLADYHFVTTQKAAERVIRMGENPNNVFVTGCPSIDLAAQVVEEPGPQIDPFEKFGGVGSLVNLTHGYLVVMQHPVTSEYQSARQDITETLYAVRDLGLPTLWFWPNVDAGSDGTSKGIRHFRETEQSTNIHFFKDIPPLDFLRLVNHSRCIVGNSSVAIRECSYMGTPAVNIGNRQAGRERGPNVIDVGYKRLDIMAAIQNAISQPRPQRINLYGDGHAGERIADLLAVIPAVVEKRLTY